MVVGLGVVGCLLWVMGGCGGNTNISQSDSITPIIELWVVGCGSWVVGGCGGNATIQSYLPQGFHCKNEVWSFIQRSKVGMTWFCVFREMFTKGALLDVNQKHRSNRIKMCHQTFNLQWDEWRSRCVQEQKLFLEICKPVDAANLKVIIHLHARGFCK